MMENISALDVQDQKEQMMKIKLIKQRNLADCGHCCLAMALRKSYAEIVRSLGHTGIRNGKSFGTYADEIVAASYRTTGHFWSHVYSLEGMGIPNWKREGYGVLKILPCKDLIPIIKHWSLNSAQGAILSVESLNLKRSVHFTYYHNGEVYDPSNYKTYKSLPRKFDSVILTRA